MRRYLVLLLLLCGFVSNGVAVMITEFCADPYLHDDADEYIVLSGHGRLDNITISDNHGGFRFPPGTIIDGSLTVARSGAAFFQSHGRYPDFEWQDHSPIVPDVISGDLLRLANSGDVLIVYENAGIIQNISWPGDVSTREGQVHYYENGMWDPRPLMLGQSRFAPEEFTDVSLKTFVSPDNSLGVFITAVDNAAEQILLNVYEFSNPAIAESLIAAHERNVSVTVLVEGGPVGGISTGDKAALFLINQSGIPVYAMAPASGEHAPYRYDHAKYAIIDGKTVLITSENFKYSGFPPSGISGNRGWGVILESRDLASYFAMVFNTDLHDPTVRPYYGSAGIPEPVPAVTYRKEFGTAEFSGATVRPVISPDTSSEILDLINSASECIEIEQAYITNESKTTLNPYLAAAVNASRRGVHVRVLLDSYWYNTEDNSDNDEMAALINIIGQSENIPLEARCADLGNSGVEKIHNKGVIVDSRKVLVSSINWNSNSPNFNREVGVIIDHPGVACYFRDVFEDDWAPAVRVETGQPDFLKFVIVLCVLGLLCWLYYRRHIR